MAGTLPRAGCLALSRRVLALALAGATALPQTAAAAPAAATGDLAAFDAGFRAGQEQFNRGEFLVAARTWSKTAELLPESAEHRDNRVAIYEYLAEAYQKAVANGASEEIVREALTVLDAYAEGYQKAYGDAALPERVATTRDAFRKTVDEADAAATPEPADTGPKPEAPPPPTRVQPPQKPWKGLAVGGGIAVGGGAAMLALLVAGAVRAKSLERRFDDPANMCSLAAPSGDCAEILADGQRAEKLAIAGVVVAPLLLGAGVAMLVVAARRKSSRHTLAPTLGRGSAGLSWQLRF